MLRQKLQIKILLSPQTGDGKTANILKVQRIGSGSYSTITGRNGLAGKKCSGELPDVVTLIAVCRPGRIARLDTKAAGLHGEGKIDYLLPGVIVVELAADIPAGSFSKRQRVSPIAAPLPCPICSGPVGLALTNSTCTFLPAPDSEQP